MTNQEAIDAIRFNWPDERYSILREALTLAIDALEKVASSNEPPERQESKE